MKIKWYGHSAFYLATDGGARIIIDPYESQAFGGAIAYGSITDEADLVLTSHEHDDHSYTKDLKGKFVHIKEKGTYEEKGVKIRAIETFHDTSRGQERGKNLIFLITADDITIAHLGDLGHILEDATLQRIGKIDILLLPVGGFYTIDAKEATRVMGDLKPSLTIPMHYKTKKCGLPIGAVDEFIKDKQKVTRVNTSEILVTKATLPKTEEIVVMKYAL